MLALLVPGVGMGGGDGEVGEIGFVAPVRFQKGIKHASVPQINPPKGLSGEVG